MISSIHGLLQRGLPTLLVLMFLGATACVGHHFDWKVPKFSQLFASADDADELCEIHGGVPKSICVECQPKLLPKLASSWCRTHGVHNCPFERTDVVQANSRPVTQADLDRADRALKLKARPENGQNCKLHERRIQFTSKEAMDKLGIDVGLVREGPVLEAVSASGEITYEQPRVAPHFVAVPGRIWQVTDKGVLGAHVKRGDVLALVDAADVGKAKAEFLQAYAQLELRTKTLTTTQTAIGQGAVPAVRLIEVETAQREAQIRLQGAHQALLNLGLAVPLDDWKGIAAEEMTRRLQFFGMPENVASRLNARTTTSSLTPILASRDGTVIAVKVAEGEMVDPSRTLFVVADTSRLWLTVHVRQEDARYLRVRNAGTGTAGQTVRFRPDGAGADVVGELIWTSTAVDEKTRTVPFRAELPNADGRLRANTFGTGQIVLREEPQAIVVPSDAVYWEGDCTVVFVRDKHFFEKDFKVFHVRTVRPGVRTGDFTEIIAGVLPGEVVATRNGAALRAELLKGNIGAGCSCGH